MSGNYVIGDVITSRILSLISPRSVSIPSRLGRENRDPRPSLTDFQTCGWGLDFGGTAGTDGGGSGAVAPRRRGRFWVLGGEGRGSRRASQRAIESTISINHQPPCQAKKKTSESSHLYRYGQNTLSPGPASNNSTRNDPVHDTIINNQAIPSGIPPAQAGARMTMMMAT